MAVVDWANETPDFESWEAIGRSVDNSRGVLTTTMGQIRDAYCRAWEPDRQRLSEDLVERIREKLYGLGLDCHPKLSTRQNESVRLYRRGGQIAQLINAAHQLGPEADEKLRQVACGGEGAKAEALLQQVSGMVFRHCDTLKSQLASIVPPR